MKAYIYDSALPYDVYLRSGVTEEPAELTPRASMLVGSAAAPSGWPVPGVSLTPAFSWTHSAQLAESDNFNLPLISLKNAAKSTAEMWSAEQFAIARDAFRRGLHREAFEYIGRAIDGEESHEGYKLDYRYHFILGLIRLGSAQHHDAALLNLPKAEMSFATAGRYALCDHPFDAANSFFAAGWSAYCQGKLDQALQYSQQALALNPKLAAAHYQVAKIAAHRREPGTAAPFLAQAISLNANFAVQALQDGAFASHNAMVMDAIAAERDLAGRRASDALKELDRVATDAGLDGDSASADLDLATAVTPVATAMRMIATSKSAFEEQSLYGYVRAEKAAAAALSEVLQLRNRIANQRRAAEEAIQAAQQNVAETVNMNIGPYRLVVTAAADLGNARTAIDDAVKLFGQGSFAGYAQAEVRAKSATLTLTKMMDEFQKSALQQATAECEELDAQIDQFRSRNGRSDRSGSVKALALIGAVMAIFPGSLLSFSSMSRVGNVDWASVVLRMGISVIAFSSVGALIGMVLAPVINTENHVSDRRLESRRALVRQTIAELELANPKPDNRAN